MHELLLLTRLRSLALSGEGLNVLLSAIEDHVNLKGKHAFLDVVNNLKGAFGIGIQQLKKLEKCKRYGGQLNDEEMESFIIPLIRANEPVWRTCEGRMGGPMKEQRGL